MEAEFRANLQAVIEVMRRDQTLVDYLANVLVELGDSVPLEMPGYQLGRSGIPFEDKRLYDYENYPADLYEPPGKLVANRAALAKWGSWVNAFGAQDYDRPLFLACFGRPGRFHKRSWLCRQVRRLSWLWLV